MKCEIENCGVEVEKPVDCTSLGDVQKLLKETAKESGDVRLKNGVFNVQS